MNDFIEIVDEEYENLLKLGFALIHAETKESIEEWFRYNRARIEEEQFEDFCLGKAIVVTSSSEVSMISTTDIEFGANDDLFFSEAA
ncbi:hypothetical protein BegalDRAFT_3304 [Beggiatoa alba B18LD]|uniref:Uncharacterized protein n=1 Tax=Beggiatoa alba B18LD TaxID=395493 RepID=I3CKI0_9GAMM|nr:hypothetical protein [Beggiatoa alba]EIJ44123.1 hypothetical protein BegalDRAFT_3304 [Beggiatoa alba B18LD]